MRVVVEVVDAGALLRGMRAEAGLSQRALAARSGTSGATVAAYESGAKEPRLSTLARLAAGAEMRVELRVLPAGRGARMRGRRERRSLALAAATAAAVEHDFAAAARLAAENLDRASVVVGDNAARRWIDEWRRALKRGPKAVRAALLDPSERGHDLRQMAPFAGLLSDEERTAALAAADAFDAMLATP
jgi:transcriptional regulator with XRE-family HTH domain